MRPPACPRCCGSPCRCVVDYFAEDAGVVMLGPAVPRPVGEDPAPIEYPGVKTEVRCVGCQALYSVGWGEEAAVCLARHAETLVAHLTHVRAQMRELRRRAGLVESAPLVLEEAG